LIREALTLERLRAMDAREAAAYFVARREEGLSESEQDLLEQWLAADKANAVEIERIERAWNWFAGADDHEVLSAMRAHALKPRRRSWLSRFPAAAAAALLLLISAGLLLILSPSWRTPAPDPRADAPAAVRYASGTGVREVKLPDGSVMTLDAQSVALARFGGAERSIELVGGRAFFAVATNPGRRFAVTASEHRVVAIGTRFDVELRAGGLTVNLLEGVVAIGPVAGDVEPVRLKPGQQFIERDGVRLIRNIGPSIGDKVGWRTGLLNFDDETLVEAITEVNRYSGVQLVIRDPQVAAIRISGSFRAGDAEGFVDTVAELRPVRPARRGATIELLPAS
jgi:transmembrane sensor